MLNKRSFTLMEMMIVIALIAVALGAMTLPITKALRGERFARGVEGVIGKITLAQEVMLDFHTNVKLTLHHEKDGKITCNLEADIPLPPQIERGLNHRPRISGITEMTFEGQVKEKIELCFDRTIGSVSPGTLLLRGHGREEVIALSDYPGQIHRGTYDPNTRSSATYPEEIVSAL